MKTSLAYSVTLVDSKSGEKNSFQTAGNLPILDEAEQAGVTSIKYACRAGSCTACIGKLQKGEVDQTDQIFLDDEKMEAGYILQCVSLPLSDIEVLQDVEDDFYAEVRELGDTY